jgi:predicted transcriptional regulator
MKTIEKELIELKSKWHFSENDVKRVESSMMIHRAMMRKSMGNEVFRLVVVDAKGQPLGMVHSENETSVFSVVGK